MIAVKNDVVYKATEEVKYKELCEELINQLLNAKSVFLRDYDESSVYVHLRLRVYLESLFVDQLERLTRRVSDGELPEEAVGEFVMEYFVVQEEDRLFDADVN